MSANPSLKDSSWEEQEHAIKKIEIQHAQLSQQTEEYFLQMGISKKEIKNIEQKLLSSDLRKHVEEWSLELEARLHRDLTEIREKKELNKKYKERNLPSHALFVR